MGDRDRSDPSKQVPNPSTSPQIFNLANFLWPGGLPGARSIPQLTRTDIRLWFLVLGAMILDIGLTVIGLQNGLIERNLIALFGIELVGYAALAFLKVPALLIGIFGWLTLPETYRQLNLIGLSLPWIWAVIINSWLIYTEVI